MSPTWLFFTSSTANALWWLYKMRHKCLCTLSPPPGVHLHSFFEDFLASGIPVLLSQCLLQAKTLATSQDSLYIPISGFISLLTK